MKTSVSRIISIGFVVLMCLVSLGTFVYAEEEEAENITTSDATNATVTPDTANISADEIQSMIAESLLISMLKQSGTNETQTAAIVETVKDYYAGNASETEASPELNEVKTAIASSVLTSLLSNIGVNETVSGVVMDYVKVHANEIGSQPDANETDNQTVVSE